MDDLLKLAERCEAATGPDHPGLDTDIHEAIGNCVHRETEYYAVQSDTGFTCKACRKDTYGFTIPRYTASLDAAMTLIDERDAADFSLNKSSMSVDMGGKDWRCQVGRRCRASGRTPALAVVAAALRARSSVTVRGE